MKNIMFLTLLLAMLFLGAMSAEAASRYVRAGASGSANGTDWANAYTTLPSTLTRGDTYYIASGSYPGRTFNTAPNGTTLITICKATVSTVGSCAQAHGTDTGWLNTYGTGQAIFSGRIRFDSSYWVFDGVTGGGPVEGWNQNFGFKSTQASNDLNFSFGYTGSASNVAVRHVEVQGPGVQSGNGDGFGFGGGTIGTTISYIWMHDIGRCPVFMARGIGTPQGGSAIFEYMYVQNYLARTAVHGEIMSADQGSLPNITFRYNLFTDVQSTGGLMRNSQYSPNSTLDVYGNVFYHAPGACWEDGAQGCGSPANGIIGGWSSTPNQNVRVYHNTFVNTDQGHNAMGTAFLPGTASNLARNNLFSSVTELGGTSPHWTTVSHNHFTNGTTVGTNTTTGAVTFVNAAGFDFHLTAPTTAGITLGAPYNVDMYGVTRSATSPTRGAVQFDTGGSDIISPAAPTNVAIQ